MTTTILRFQKLKSRTELHKAGAHQHRFSETLNADPIRYQRNQILIGSNNLANDVSKAILHYKVKPRKNAVIAMDSLFTLSPEIFKNDLDAQIFRVAVESWIKKTFGKRCVSAILHLDEKTPHIHATILPLVKNKNGKIGLNARELFGPSKLSEYQRSFNSHMKKSFPQIVPPKHGNKARHSKIKAFYEELEKDAKNLKDKQLCLYEIELNQAKKSSIKRYLERFIPVLNDWTKKLEDELRQDIGLYAAELSNKYKDRTNALQFELEEALEQEPELIELNKNLHGNLKAVGIFK